MTGSHRRPYLAAVLIAASAAASPFAGARPAEASARTGGAPVVTSSATAAVTTHAAGSGAPADSVGPVSNANAANLTAPADTTGIDESDGFSLPVRISGQATMSGDFYYNRGNEARRPGSAFLMSFGPRMTVLDAVELSVDGLLSTDQSYLRQNINQLGLSPSWRWATLHVGDFSRGYSSYTMEGVRLRGAGIDLTPGNVRFSIQGGRAQRSIAPMDGGTVYQRNVIAARVGYGAESGTHLNLTFLTAKDDVSAEERALVTADTILIDTIHPDLRPEIDTRPQENVAVGLDGQLTLFDRMLTLRGEVAASLITHDLLADEVDLDADELPISQGVAGMLGRFQPVRLSTAFDYAYNLEGTVNVRGARLRGGYEEVGPGYASLGLPHMMNDRRGYHFAGTGQLWQGRLGLNGQYRHQTNNLLGQRRNTVDRNTASMTASIRPTDRLTTTLSGVLTSMVNDAASDSLVLDTRSVALTANAALQQEMLGRQTVISVGYNIQRTMDGNPLAQIPSVMTHNVTTSLQVPLSPTVSLAPSISGVLTRGEGMDEDLHNVFIGFRGNGRFLDGDLRTAANLSQTINQGRQIFAATASVSYPLGWGTDLSARARFNRYSAFNQYPGFQEALAWISISRSF